MEAFLNGSAPAFERLFRQLSPRVAAALAQMSGDAALAEDLTQTVFLKLYRARAAYQRGMLVAPWVFAIARNTLLDHRRMTRRRPESLSLDGTLPEPDTRELPTPDHSAQATLAQLLQTLSEPQRQALWLMKVQGLSVQEVAALCDASPASIKMRVHRAFRSLSKTLGRTAAERDDDPEESPK
jgi:RNA polymerase sigma-70 factor (ECF subfamily)